LEAVIDLLLEYDEAVDAAYLIVNDAEFHHREALDDARGVSYAADGTVIGIELLSPRRRGVVLDGLPFEDDVERVMRAVGFRVMREAPDRKGHG
jgi:uncharacterized protein YuzE